MRDISEIKSLIDATLDDGLEDGEVLSTDLYALYPQTPGSTIRGVLEILIRDGKVSKRKLRSGKCAYKVLL